MASIPTSKVVVTLDVETKQLLERIADNTKPDEKPDDSIDAQLLGTTQGFHVWLGECLDEELSPMDKARKLRDLHKRTGELVDFYQRRLDAKKAQQHT